MNSPKISKGASPSPRNKKKDELTFIEAMKAILDGKKVWRKEWKDCGFYGHRMDETLMLHKPDGNNYQWILSDGDMFADDWAIL